MRDVIRGHEGGEQVSDGSGFAAVRPERERVHPPLSGEHKKIFIDPTLSKMYSSKVQRGDLVKSGQAS